MVCRLGPGFHTIALSTVDVDFAKEQLDLMLQEFFLHPTGQIPAYEWNFSDVNPPVHAWATIFLYRTEQALKGEGDLEFLKRSFAKLMLNFSWWVNRKDRFGKNLFEGGFLGLGQHRGLRPQRCRCPPVATWSRPTALHGFRCSARTCWKSASSWPPTTLLSKTWPLKFADHFLLDCPRHESDRGTDGMWDEEDGFYYDVLRLPDGSATRLKVRSMVGLLPLCATTVIEPWQRERVPRVTEATERTLATDARTARTAFIPPDPAIWGMASAASLRW